MLKIGKYTADDSEIIAKNKFENEIIENNNTLKPFFSDNDKTPLWDGQIFIYKSNDKKIDNWDDKLYVQIKGRNVKSLSEGKKTFSFKTSKLKAYQRDINGTLLLVCLYTDNMDYKLYYRNLLPVDLNSILENADETKNSTSFEIYPINKGEKNAILHICLNFAKNSKKQINTEIKNMEDIENIKEIKAQYVGKDQDEFFSELLNNKIYTYATDINGKTFAIAKNENTKIFMGQEVDKNVSIDDKVYYSNYTLQRQSDGESIIIGNAITLNLISHKINFNFNGNINQKIKSLELFIDMQKKQKITINGITLQLNKKDCIDVGNYEKELEELKIIKNMFNKLGVNFTDKLEELSDTDWTNIRILVNIFEKNIKPKKPLTSQTGLCKMTIGKTVILLWIDVEKNNYYNFFEDLSSMVIIARTEEGKQPSKEDSISPYLLLTDKKIMGESNNLFEYANWNSEIVKNSFEKISRYKELAGYINEFILRLLLTYDKKSKEDILDLAMFLCEKIINQNYENEDDKDIYKINYFQIIKRQREFNEDEYDELFKLKEKVYKKDNCMLKCGVAISLEDQKDFKYYYNKLTEEEKVDFKNFPIYNLKNNDN